MLALAVADGTGTEAQIPGYVVAGKTGTAEMAVPGGYAKGVYVASFIGMVPADHPRLVVLCAVNGTPEFGGTAAAPAVRRDHAVRPPAAGDRAVNSDAGLDCRAGRRRCTAPQSAPRVW